MDIRRGTCSDEDWERHRKKMAAIERAQEIVLEQFDELLKKYPSGKYVAVKDEKLFVGDDPDELRDRLGRENVVFLCAISAEVKATLEEIVTADA